MRRQSPSGCFPAEDYYSVFIDGCSVFQHCKVRSLVPQLLLRIVKQILDTGSARVSFRILIPFYLYRKYLLSEFDRLIHKNLHDHILLKRLEFILENIRLVSFKDEHVLNTREIIQLEQEACRDILFNEVLEWHTYHKDAVDREDLNNPPRNTTSNKNWSPRGGATGGRSRSPGGLSTDGRSKSPDFLSRKFKGERRMCVISNDTSFERIPGLRKWEHILESRSFLQIFQLNLGIRTNGDDFDGGRERLERGLSSFLTVDENPRLDLGGTTGTMFLKELKKETVPGIDPYTGAVIDPMSDHYRDTYVRKYGPNTPYNFHSPNNPDGDLKSIREDRLMKEGINFGSTSVIMPGIKDRLFNEPGMIRNLFSLEHVLDVSKFDHNFVHVPRPILDSTGVSIMPTGPPGQPCDVDVMHRNFATQSPPITGRGPVMDQKIEDRISNSSPKLSPTSGFRSDEDADRSGNQNQNATTALKPQLMNQVGSLSQISCVPLGPNGLQQTATMLLADCNGQIFLPQPPVVLPFVAVANQDGNASALGKSADIGNVADGGSRTELDARKSTLGEEFGERFLQKDRTFAPDPDFSPWNRASQDLGSSGVSNFGQISASLYYQAHGYQRPGAPGNIGNSDSQVRANNYHYRDDQEGYNKSHGCYNKLTADRMNRMNQTFRSDDTGFVDKDPDIDSSDLDSLPPCVHDRSTRAEVEEELENLRKNDSIELENLLKHLEEHAPKSVLQENKHGKMRAKPLEYSDYKTLHNRVDYPKIAALQEKLTRIQGYIPNKAEKRLMTENQCFVSELEDCILMREIEDEIERREDLSAIKKERDVRRVEEIEARLKEREERNAILHSK